MNKKVLVGLLCGIIMNLDPNSLHFKRKYNKLLPLPPQITSGLVEKMTLDDLAATANIIVLGEVVDLTYEKEADGDIRKRWQPFPLIRLLKVIH